MIRRGSLLFPETELGTSSPHAELHSVWSFNGYPTHHIDCLVLDRSLTVNHLNV